MTSVEQLYLSVIIPTHNRLSLLRRTLTCLREQTYPAERFEVIVVDNGSEDGTEASMRELEKDGHIRYVRQHPHGPAVARNVGARLAHGDVLVFTDDDCLPAPTWLSKLAESWRCDPAPAGIGGRIENKADGHWLQAFQAAQDMHHRNSRADGQPLFLDTASASYRRDLFVDYGGFPEHSRYPVAEDSLFGLRLTADGQKLKLNPEAVVQHVGRTSLRAMFMQSFRRGQGEAVLMLVYPQHFTGPPSRGLRRLVHRWLNRLYDQAQRRSPLFFGLAAALRRGLFALPEITSYFMGRYLPSQMRRYAAMGLSRRRRALYWLLEWLDCLPKCAARTFYTFIYARSAARDGRRVPELHDAEGL